MKGQIRALLLIGGCALGAGCGHSGPTMHSVGAVERAFAAHGVQLVVVERTRVSTTLVSRGAAKALPRGRPALAAPRRRPKKPYFVSVITDRRWARNLERHMRKAAAVVAGRPGTWKRFSTLRDNVLLAYPAGPPKAISRLKAALADIA